MLYSSRKRLSVQAITVFVPRSRGCVPLHFVRIPPVAFLHELLSLIGQILDHLGHDRCNASGDT
jgi:hypothetical protein